MMHLGKNRKLYTKPLHLRIKSHQSEHIQKELHTYRLAKTGYNLYMPKMVLNTSTQKIHRSAASSQNTSSEPTIYTMLHLKTPLYYLAMIQLD
jgi:hypothetical protein